MRFLIIFVSLAITVFAGGLWVWNLSVPEADRLPPISSPPSDRQNLIGMIKGFDSAESSNDATPIVKAIEMPVVPTAYVEVVSGSVTEVKGDEIYGTVVSPDSVVSFGPSEWEGALVSLTSVNAELAAVEKMAGRNGLLPDAGEIEAAFGALNRELNTLKTKRLSDGERIQIRESLQNSAGDLLSRIGVRLNARQENHLVDLANAELARVMESIQGL